MATKTIVLLAWVVLIGLGIVLPIFLEFRNKSSKKKKVSLKPSLKYQKETGMFLWPKHPYIALAIYDLLLIWAIYVLLTNP